MMSIELVESSFGAVMNFEVISSEISFLFYKVMGRFEHWDYYLLFIRLYLPFCYSLWI